MHLPETRAGTANKVACLRIRNLQGHGAFLKRSFRGDRANLGSSYGSAGGRSSGRGSRVLTLLRFCLLAGDSSGNDGWYWGCGWKLEVGLNIDHSLSQPGESGSELVQRRVEGVQFPIERQEVERKFTVRERGHRVGSSEPVREVGGGKLE